MVLGVVPAANMYALAQVANSTNAMSQQLGSSSPFVTYQNSITGFKLQYPSYWQKFENNTSDSSAVYFVEPLSGARFTVASFEIPQTSLSNEPKNLIISTQPFQPYNSTQTTSTTIAGNPANRTELAYFYAGH